MDICGKCLLGKGSSQCKGPVARVYPVYSRNKEVSVPGTEVETRGRVRVDEVRARQVM